MQYTEYNPSERFRSIVRDYWVFEINEEEKFEFPIQHETIPDSCLSIVAIRQPYFEGIRLLGPHHLKFDTPLFPNSCYVGIRIQPWIELKNVTFRKIDTVNQTLASDESLAIHFKPLLDQSTSSRPTVEKIESCLTMFLSTHEVFEHQIIRYICLNLMAGKSIKSITETVPMSIRVIQKKFKSVTGITMRQYAHNSRLRKVLIDFIQKPSDRKEIIYRYNYYDPSHFINDFKKKMKRPFAEFKHYMEFVDVVDLND